MKNFNEYIKRFYNLMESEIGDVKPIILEQDFEKSYNRQYANLPNQEYSNIMSSWKSKKYLDPYSPDFAKTKQDLSKEAPKSSMKKVSGSKTTGTKPIVKPSDEELNAFLNDTLKSTSKPSDEELTNFLNN